jgi:CRISPR-associated protein Csm2
VTQSRNIGPGGAGGERPRTEIPDQQALTRIIEQGDVEMLVTWAEKLGRGLALTERLTTSQVRGFFGTVRQIQSEAEAQAARVGVPPGETADSLPLDDQAHRKLILLKPKLAYQAQRDRENRRGEGVLRLSEVLVPAIDLIARNQRRFKRFVEFFEAILAYHKAAGGKE